ncbi:MAG: CTP synthase [Thermoproteota archaeon]|nr:CTP synthase [Candidatus Brockarchaeota archaeon]
MHTNYIFVTGGVISGIGKGITAASIGKILQARGYRVTAVKIDPYLNWDAGTLRPTEHGEVWVTEDAGEIDQDLGHYERFLDIDIPKKNNITTGQIYGTVIERERRGEYLGKTVEVIPHITDEIKRRIKAAAEEAQADFTIVEIGGTVGEYQSEIYYMAARLMKAEGEKVIFIHVAYLPIPKHLGEMKTKPVQQSVERLGELGIQPDFIICRAEGFIDDVRKEKISIFCNVPKDHIISNPDLENVYELPLIFEEQNLGSKILEKFGVEQRKPELSEWKKFVDALNNATKKVRIGIVGKYFEIGEYRLPDAYISVIEAVKHACAANFLKPVFKFMDSMDFEEDPEKLSILNELDGIIVPGGFGAKGIEGKIAAIKYVRERKIPFLGLCLGLQLAVVEYARNVIGLEKANSTEFDPNTPHPVIDILPEQREILKESRYGASMRLGAYPAVLKPGTLVYRLYGNVPVVYERHRHRYEVNPKYHEALQKHGMVFSGVSPDGRLVEFIELRDHPFFVATQAHPEFKSRPLKPAPLFKGFIEACIKKL